MYDYSLNLYICKEDSMPVPYDSSSSTHFADACEVSWISVGRNNQLRDRQRSAPDIYTRKSIQTSLDKVCRKTYDKCVVPRLLLDFGMSFHRARNEIKAI
jgi:hypothetical protein